MTEELKVIDDVIVVVMVDVKLLKVMVTEPSAPDKL
jgi:hypothetical protein